MFSQQKNMMRSSNELHLDGSRQTGILQQFLRNVRKKLTSVSTEITWGKTSVDIPYKKLAPLLKEVSAAHSGPEDGINNLTSNFSVSESDSEICDIQDFTSIDWKKWHHRAYGMATSLYEQTPDGEHLSGDPIADVFAIIARPNNCILILADGVNWGEKARLAARSAVKGCMEYLNEHLFNSTSTQDVMEHLLHSFQHAQKCITNSEGTMTTLCAGVVCELQGTNKWGLCTLNVGDSLAFVYNRRTGLREVTIGSHLDIQRDVANPGGSLGRVDGYNPDLANLTCSFTVLEAGDMVFLTSDGVTDNFDPVICKPSPKEITSFNEVLLDSKENSYNYKRSSPGSKMMEFEERHIEMIKEMTEALVSLEDDEEIDLSAKEVCAFLVLKVMKRTQRKREHIEGAFRQKNGKTSLEKIFRHAKSLPGKLDHACVVAYEVGNFTPNHLRLVCDESSLARQWSFDSGYQTVESSSVDDSFSVNTILARVQCK